MDRAPERRSKTRTCNATTTESVRPVSPSVRRQFLHLSSVYLRKEDEHERAVAAEGCVMIDYGDEELDELAHQRKCIEALKAVDTTDDTEWGYGLGGLVWIPVPKESDFPDVDVAYPKPVVLSAKEEQDRLWRLVEQYSRG